MKFKEKICTKMFNYNSGMFSGEANGCHAILRPGLTFSLTYSGNMPHNTCNSKTDSDTTTTIYLVLVNTF